MAWNRDVVNSIAQNKVMKSPGRSSGWKAIGAVHAAQAIKKEL